MPRRAKAKSKSKTTEHLTKLIRPTMETPAWRALSTCAQALYHWLKLEWRGLEYNNNGRISLAVSTAARGLGVKPDTAARAFHDLFLLVLFTLARFRRGVSQIGCRARNSKRRLMAT